MATTHSTTPATTTLPTGDWHVVAERSKLGFATRLMGFMPIRGSYSGYQGELHVEESGAATGSLTIESATLTTGIKKRDKHLHAQDFFHAEAHPHLRFELAAITPSAEDGLVVTGTLHIRDQAQPISAPIAVTQAGPDALRLEADLPVDQTAAGFEFKHLPKKVAVNVALELERTR